MKSTQEIIEELNELKDSLRADSDHPLKVEEALSQALARIIDLANVVNSIEENIPREASQKELNEIFED